MAAGIAEVYKRRGPFGMSVSVHSRSQQLYQAPTNLETMAFGQVSLKKKRPV